MAKVYVVFQFDVEDFVTPETDEVLLRLAQIMEGFGVKASFCVVGEKARVMESRGRTDVIDALRGQDVAYQSNLHSVHPVISEYLSEKGWDEGVEEVRLRESQGVEAVSRIFGVKPSAFIQPGGSWAPETPYALRSMGIPVYADGIFESEPFWFCGCLCLKAAMHFPEHSTREDLEVLASRFEEIYNSKEAGGLITVVLHPCMFLTENFWDAVNFAGGTNPPDGRLKKPKIRPERDVEESLRTFERFVGFILEHPDVEVVTFRDLPKLYSDPEERTLTLNQAFELADEASKRNGWYLIGGISVSPAEALRLLLELLVEGLSKGMEPMSIPVRFTLGPTSKPSTFGSRIRLSLKEILDLCRSAKAFMDRCGRVPAALELEGSIYGPGDLLKLVAETVLSYRESGSLPEALEVSGLSPLPEVVDRWSLAERVRSQWRWVIFPEGFESKRIEEMTLWQSWTMRPAVLQHVNS